MFFFHKAINLVECPEFRQLLLLLRPDLKETVIPHRSKLCKLVIDGWRRSFQELKRDLAVRPLLPLLTFLILSTQAAVGRISFTMDIWSDQNRRGHLALTAHWIATIIGTTSLKLEADLIAFHRIHGDHDGESLATILLQLLDRAGVTRKVR